MAQQLIGDFNIDPTTTSGTELASILNRLNSAVLSMQSGTSRPAYAVQGYKWLDVTDTLNLEKFYTGTTDLSILEYDTVNNVAQVNGGASFTDDTKAIKNKVSSTIDAVPVPADVQAGEILVNTADEKIFIKNASGDMVDVSGNSVLTGFKNKIINGDFSVNQYADIDTAPVVMVDSKYHIDRYEGYIGSVTGTIQRLAKFVINGKYVNSVKCIATSTATGIIGISQKMVIFYNGETKTMGIWVKSNSINARILLYDGVTYTSSTTHSGGGAYEFLSLTKAISVSATQLRVFVSIVSDVGTNVSITSGDYIESTMWQLEDGSKATNFEQRPIGLEFSLCQRYYLRFNDTNKLSYQSGSWDATTNFGTIHFPTSMRVAPTLSYSNSSAIDIYQSGTIYNSTAISLTVDGETSVEIQCISSGLTGGHASFGRLNLATDYIELDAEL